MYTVADLKGFTQDIANEFNAGHIRAPVHLDGGNEQHLIDIFKEVKPEDWLVGQWRMQLKCLLKGVPPADLKAAIMAGRSISLCFPKYRILSSAIAGGHLPIALGIAMGIKAEGGGNQVWCWLGDMTSEMGIAYECIKYASWHDLPVHWVVEDNGKSVVTDTRDTWFGCNADLTYKNVFLARRTHFYRYDLPYPHSGAGKRVNF